MLLYSYDSEDSPLHLDLVVKKLKQGGAGQNEDFFSIFKGFRLSKAHPKTLLTA